ncbi:permease [Clostridia bacterium]|nr:permease [Clostridia bacterium]
MLLIVAQNLCSLLILILAGYAAAKIKLINDEISAGLSGLLLKLTLPCTIIMSMQREFSWELLQGGAVVLFASIIVYVASFFLAVAVCKVFKIKGAARGVWIFAIMFPNVGYMGFPVLSAVYGEGSLFFVSMNNMVFNILSSTWGVKIISNMENNERLKVKTELRDRNFLPWATGIGFLMFLTSFSLPETIAYSFRALGGMTTPLSMIIIGALLAKSSVKSVFSGGYVIAVSRLLVIPALTFLVFSRFVGGLELGVIVLLAGMPTGAVTAIYAVQYKADTFAAGRAVAITTILSLLTLPIISLLY